MPTALCFYVAVKWVRESDDPLMKTNGTHSTWPEINRLLADLQVKPVTVFCIAVRGCSAGAQRGLSLHDEN